MKKFYILVALISVFLGKGIGQIEPKHEVRSTWVATVSNIDWPKNADRNNPDAQKAELIRMLDLYKSINLNAIFLQVRPECDAFYNSAYEPWSRYLTYAQGDDPGYDPLQFAIDEAHKRGIEVHAWLNPYRINASTSDGGDYYHSTHIYSEHPEWAIEYSSGKKILNPGRPEVMSYIGSVVRDIVSKYNVDGVHFDDYFYSYDGTPSDLDATEYAAYGGSMNLADWRRDNINRMIDTVYKVIQEENPTVRFGVSPFGIYKNGVPSGIAGLDAYSTIYCDPLAWLSDGNVDYISPQLYWPTGGAQDFETLANWWSDQVYANNRHLYTGNGTYRLSINPGLMFASEQTNDLHENKSYFDTFNNTSTNIDNNLSMAEMFSTSDPVADWTLGQIGLQIDIVRSNADKNGLGNVYFSAKDFDRVNGLANYMVDNKYTHPALFPEMTWKNPPIPERPANLREEIIDTENYLIWDYTLVNANDRFAIYTSDILTDSLEIIADPSNLKEIKFENQIRLADLSFTNTTTIVVTTVSAYGKESIPAKHSIDNDVPSIISQSPADGATVHKTEVFSWDSDSANALFQLQIASNSSFSNPIVSSAWSAFKEQSISGLELDGESTYFWRVRAKASATGSYSSARSFITGYPTNPEITAPANLSQNISTTPRIYWNGSGTADSILVQISKSSSFSSLVTEEKFDASKEYGIITTELEKATNYYLRIAASNEYGNSSFSGFNTFRTTAGEIPFVNALSPQEAAVVASFDEFEWETSTTTGTIKYYLEIAIDENFSSILANSGWISGTTILVSDLNLGGDRTYYWHVKAKSEFGESEYTSTRSFTTGYPTKPNIISPVHLSENNDVNPLIIWNTDENTESVYVEVAESSDFNQVDNSETFDVSNINARLSNPLQGNTWYFIRIAAANSYGNSIFSSNKYFKTEAGSQINDVPFTKQDFKIYPNPYIENQTKISLTINKPQALKIDLLNSIGKTITTIYENNKINIGYHEIGVNIDRNISSGIYFIRVSDFRTVNYAPLVVVGE